MPKMKTQKSISKRFKLTGGGRLKRNRPGRRHLLTKKSPSRKRKLQKPTLLNKTHEKTYKQIMGVV